MCVVEIEEEKVKCVEKLVFKYSLALSLSLTLIFFWLLYIGCVDVIRFLPYMHLLWIEEKIASFFPIYV